MVSGSIPKQAYENKDCIKTAKLSDFEGFPMFSPEIKDILVLVGSQDFRPTEAIRSHF